MSYEMMEALLVQKIASLRKSEATLARSLRSAGCGVRFFDFSAVQQRIDRQIFEVEQLLAAMDTAPVSESMPAMAAVDAAPQMTPSAWM